MHWCWLHNELCIRYKCDCCGSHFRWWLVITRPWSQRYQHYFQFGQLGYLLTNSAFIRKLAEGWLVNQKSWNMYHSKSHCPMHTSRASQFAIHTKKDKRWKEPGKEGPQILFIKTSVFIDCSHNLGSDFNKPLKDY